MATIGLVPLILMLITRTTSISIAQIPTHPTTTLVGTASLCVVLLITRSGFVLLGIGVVRVIGFDGYSHTGTTHINDNNIFYAVFNNNEFYVSGYNLRWYGLTMRCLAI